MHVISIRINLVRIYLFKIVKIALWSSKANVSRCQTSRQIRAFLDIFAEQLIQNVIIYICLTQTDYYNVKEDNLF